MSETVVFEPGNYRYIPSVFQYSSGVAAEEGYEIERVRLASPVPLDDAARIVEEHLAAIGRPLTAFAQCELRSREPHDADGFLEFNKRYVAILNRWGIHAGGLDELSPVARTNVCPRYRAPETPSMFAFSYTVPQARPGRGGFMTSGGADGGSVLHVGTSPEGLRAKVRFVLDEQESRLRALGFGWEDAVTTRAYTDQNIGHLVGEELASRGAMQGGLAWFYARPPLDDKFYEMDVHGAVRDLVVG